MTTDPTPADEPRTPAATPEQSSDSPTEQPTPASPDASSDQPSRRKVLIGSQRDPAAYRPKPQRDRIPIVGKVNQPEPPAEEPPEPPAVEMKPPAAPPAEAPVELAPAAPVVEVEVAAAIEATVEAAVEATVEADLEAASPALFAAAQGASFPPPNVRDKLSPELEAELEAALSGQSMDDLIADSDSVTKQEVLEPETRLNGVVVTITREDVFVEIGGREQGIVALKHFAEPPEPGTSLKVIVVRYNREDGLYELTLPNVTADVADWSDLNEGMLVDTMITGHNSGGLECEVNKIRGFIPISQISLYRVEDLEPFIGERLTCLVTEANPDRRNLVLSRRALLEREREQARQELLASLAPGQVHEGVVRKLMDFGAFVDLGGVDGLLHVSQLAWARVNHPSDVLTEGQTIQVRIEKYDPASQRISLGYRELMESPWANVEANYPIQTLVKGTVTKLMDFGAFVELEPGIEGLVHISELSHKRVNRSSDVVKEGQEVDVMIQSVDADAQRISLSMKEASAPPESLDKTKDDGPGEAAPLPKSVLKQMSNKPLKGGTGKGSGGESIGLNW